MVRVRIRRVGSVEAALPCYATEGAAGMDLCAAVAAPVEMAPGQRMAIPTGFELEIPPGYEAQIRPRSGLAIRHGVTVVNAPGTIDSDYRGEVRVLLVNLGTEAHRVEPGARIAQMVVAPVTRVSLELSDQLAPSVRGAGGFGSTGG